MSQRDVRKAAQELKAAGYHISHLRPRSKQGYGAKYLQHSASPDKFQLDDNIGIRPTKGIVCVDLDCAEALKVSPRFLPPTTAVSGRKSKPRSHHYYNIGDYKLRTVKHLAQDGVLGARLKAQGIDGDVIKKKCGVLDYLFDKCHVNAPPSIHPSGEVLQWHDGLHKPTTASEGDVYRAFQLIYLSVMLERYRPAPGAKHDWCNAFAGYCKSRGVKKEELSKVYEVVGDPKLSDRFTEIRTTYDQEKVTQVSKLRELMEGDGDQFIKSIDGVLGHINLEFLDGLNKKYFICRDGSNYVYDETCIDEGGSLKKHNHQAFVSIECKRVQVSEKRSTTQGALWLSSDEKTVV